jgi:hypothetical protein
MTKKHFKELALNLHFLKPDDSSRPKFLQWELDVLGVASACKRFNPKFDNEKFLAACGMTVGNQLRGWK